MAELATLAQETGHAPYPVTTFGAQHATGPRCHRAIGRPRRDPLYFRDQDGTGG